jgi:Uma2 family endonuclease
MAQLAHHVPNQEKLLDAPPHENVIVLNGVSWGDYQRLLEIRGERSVPRFTYCEGVLELMSPSRYHEHVKSSLGCLLEAWCIARGVEFTPYGSWTLESKEAERGVEPDECYCLGETAALDEPEHPDLAIEVIYTSGSISKLDVYRKLRVPEVWTWKNERLAIHTLAGDHYETAERSRLLPELDVAQLASFALRRPVSEALRAYRAALDAG